MVLWAAADLFVIPNMIMAQCLNEKDLVIRMRCGSYDNPGSINSPIIPQLQIMGLYLTSIMTLHVQYEIYL